MNNSILLDQEYKQRVKTAINHIKTYNSDANPQTLWELIKGEIRSKTIKYTSFKHKEEKEQINKLNVEISRLKLSFEIK